MRSIVPVLLSLLVSAACTDGRRLSVDLRSDWVPAEEFVEATVTVSPIEGTPGEPRIVRFVAQPGMNAVRGLRVASLVDVDPGEYRVAVMLLDGLGAELDRGEDAIRIERDYSVVLVLDRACAAVQCGEGESCVAGSCAQRNGTGVDAACRTDSECDALLGVRVDSCASGVCVAGGCFFEMREGACSADEWCEPSGGCMPREGASDAGPPDAGPFDAGADGGPVDAGFDAGVDAGIAPPPPSVTSPSRGSHQPGRVTLGWTDVPGAATYDISVVECSVADIAAGVCDFGTPSHSQEAIPRDSEDTTPSAHVDALAPGRYAWAVRSCDASARCSDWSSPAGWFIHRHATDVDASGGAELFVSAHTSAQGSVFVYRDGDTSSAPDRAMGVGLTDQADFGISMSIADANGDEFSDLLVGAPAHDGSGPNVEDGIAFLFLGASSGLELATPIELGTAGHVSDNFGRGVLIGPDLDRDGGIGDLVVGEPGSGGAVRLYRGASALSGTLPPVARLIPPGAVGDSFGFALEACDMTGDGHPELLVSDVTLGAGRVYVIEDPFGASPKMTWVESPEADSSLGKFGDMLRCAGDISGDGIEDLVIGAPFLDVGAEIDAGRAYVLFGGPELDTGGEAVHPRLVELVPSSAPFNNDQFGTGISIRHPLGAPAEIFVGAPTAFGGDERLHRFFLDSGATEWALDPQGDDTYRVVGGVSAESTFVTASENFGSCVVARDDGSFIVGASTTPSVYVLSSFDLATRVAVATPVGAGAQFGAYCR